MSKKNLVNLVNTNNTPANTANTALTGKESVMENKREIEATIEGCLLTATVGLTLPVVATFTQRLAMEPAEIAFMLLITHAFTVAAHGIAGSCDKSPVAKAINASYVAVTSALTGMALFRCLVEGISNGLPVDYSSLPAFIIVCAVVLMSFAAATAFASTAKK